METCQYHKVKVELSKAVVQSVIEYIKCPPPPQSPLVPPPPRKSLLAPLPPGKVLFTKFIQANRKE